jgi:hypothetical protein
LPNSSNLSPLPEPNQANIYKRDQLFNLKPTGKNQTKTNAPHPASWLRWPINLSYPRKEKCKQDQSDESFLLLLR